MRICFVSDIHIDRVTCGVSRFEDIWDSLVKIISYEYDWLFFLGDWADPDNRVSLRSGAAAIKFEDILDRPTYWITGNHDVLEDGYGTHTLLSLQAKYRESVFSRPKYVEENQFRLLALPYASRANAYQPGEFIKKARETIKDDKRPLIIIGHLDCEGITPGSEVNEMARGREVFWPTKEIAECFPDALCFGGHIHQKQVYEKDGCRIQIVGSLSRLSFDEQDHVPGIHILDTETRELEFIPIEAPVFDTFYPGVLLAPNIRFVRVTQPAAMEDSEFKKLKEYLVSCGCAIKVLPKERKRKPVAKTKAKAVNVANPRQVVESLIETSNSKDKKSLKDECQARMDEHKI